MRRLILKRILASLSETLFCLIHQKARMQLVKNILLIIIHFSIINITKFSNLIAYQQARFEPINKNVIGQFTRHACVTGQYASFSHAVIGQLHLNGSYFRASRSIKNKRNC